MMRWAKTKGNTTPLAADWNLARWKLPRVEALSGGRATRRLSIWLSPQHRNLHSADRSQK